MRSIPLASVMTGRPEDADVALVRAAQADLAAFAPLYQRYRDRVYAYLRTRTRSPEDAADLTQQVFLQALDALPRYRSRGVPFAAWLLRIAHNTAANYHKRYRQTVAWDLLPEALQPVAADDVAALNLRLDAAHQLQTVLQTCDATTREILALRYAAGLSVEEIARVVGKSETAVKKRLTRALSGLKERYHDEAR